MAALSVLPGAEKAHTYRQAPHGGIRDDPRQHESPTSGERPACRQHSDARLQQRRSGWAVPLG